MFMIRVNTLWGVSGPRMFLPCVECDDAPCMKAAKDDAVIKGDDGIVAIGRRMFV